MAELRRDDMSKSLASLPVMERERMKLMEEHRNLTILRQTPQLIALHTIIRDVECSRRDFVFYSNRIIRLLLEEAICNVEYEETTVNTPTGVPFTGLKFKSKMLAVSIMRAGESMETVMRDIASDIRIGKILIQRDESSEDKHPVFIYEKLPKDTPDRTVLLLDPMLATGGSVCCAIDCLVTKHKVPEDQIIFVNVLACPDGLKALFKNYPKVKVITSMVDPILNEDKYIVPGLGDFGDRYFGTTN